VPGCPQPTIVQYIRDAAIRTCERTLYWRYLVPLFNVLPGVSEYTYNKPYKYQASFKEEQRYASDNNLGLWSPTTCDGEASAVEASAVAPVVVPAVEEGGGRTFYTSSHSTAKYYYCDTDPGWKSLSTTNLRSFSSESALLASYPSRTLHEPCK
jgi:hypothetical protein